MTTEAALVLDALGTQRQRVRNLVRSTGELAARSAPGLIRHPLAAAGTAVRNVQALGRMMKPPTTRLSPIMVARRGWSRFAILDVDLNTLRGAAKLHGATVNDAFLAALGNGFARYHEKHGAPVQELRAAVGVNARQAGDSPYGNQARGGTLVIPVSTDDSAKCMAACHETVALLREDVRQPLATAVGTVLGAMGPLVSPFVGALMKNCDFAAVNVPGFDAQLYLGGAEMTAMYGFGPSMGTAVNIALVSYRDRAFIGFNVDAAAIPDVAVFVECVRLGFDAVLALNQ